MTDFNIVLAILAGKSIKEIKEMQEQYIQNTIISQERRYVRRQLKGMRI